MAYPIIVDTSSFQSDSLAFFNTLKSYGVSGAIVKLSEGVKYTSPKAANQIANAYKAFGVVAAYHFWHGASNEAAYFLDKVKKMGLDKTTWLAIDVEAADLPSNCTSGINRFLSYLYSNGITICLSMDQLHGSTMAVFIRRNLYHMLNFGWRPMGLPSRG